MGNAISTLRDSANRASGAGAQAPARMRPTELLAAAEQKLDKLKKTAVDAKEGMARGGLAVLDLLEETAACAAGSAAEGFWGDKLKLAKKVDARLAGLAGVAWGVIDAARGKGSGGRHAQRVGTGLLMSYVASVGVDAGKTLREKHDQKGSGGGAPAGGGGAPAAVRGDEGGGGAVHDMQLSDPPSATPRGRGMHRR